MARRDVTLDVTFPLEWTRLRFDRCKTALPRRYRMMFNRYPGCKIGAGVQIGQMWLGIRWGRPGKPIVTRAK